jgi:transposase
MENRRTYDRAFKEQAVALSEQEGVAIGQVACELGIDVKLLYRWRSEQHQAGENAFPGHGRQAGEVDEIRRLQRELARVQMERDILKKALAVLAQPLGPPRATS